MALNGPGSVVTYAGLASAIRGLQIADNTGHNFKLDITANAGQVIAGDFPLSTSWSLTGGASFINIGLLTLDYFPAAAGFDTVTATLTDLTTNTSTTKTIDVTVKPAGNFTSIDGPAEGVGTITGGIGFRNGSVAYGINNAGEVVGSYANRTAPVHAVSGFLLSNGSFTTLNNPFATQTSSTEPNGIDELHQIVGSYSGTSPGVGIHAPPTSYESGFLYSNGNWISFDASSRGTHLGGINASGQIAGYHTIVPSNPDQAFIYQNGSYQNIGPAGTEAFGNNDAGQVVGAFAPTLGESSVPPPTHGFLYSNGVFSLLDAPSASSTTARDVNNAGLIVGLPFQRLRHTRFRIQSNDGRMAAHRRAGCKVDVCFGRKRLEPDRRKLYRRERFDAWLRRPSTISASAHSGQCRRMDPVQRKMGGERAAWLASRRVSCRRGRGFHR